MNASAMGPYKRHLKRSVAALFVVFLHFSSQVSSLGRIRNRYFSFWERADAFAIATDIVLLGVLVFLSGVLVDRLAIPWLRKLYDHLFVLGLGSGILSVFHSQFHTLFNQHPILSELMWLALVGIVAFSLGRPTSRLVGFACNLCLIFSPLIILILFPMFEWENWATPDEPFRIVRKSNDHSHPIFLFVFDEWSYARSTENGSFMPFLTNLRKLCDQSFVFRSAQSPSIDTFKSLPMIIYQTSNYESIPGVFIKENQGEWVNDPGSAGKAQSLFSLARQHGYSTFLEGFYLPYRKLLGDQVDWVQSHDDYPRGDTFIEKMRLVFFANMRYWTDPISRAKWRLLEASIFSRHWRNEVKVMQTETFDLLDKCPNSTFALIHFPLPHAPYIFDSDGSYRGTYSVDLSKNEDDDQDRMSNGTPEDYERHLKFLDLLVGKITDHLHSAGKFDEAMIIITSDHSWRYETDSRYKAGSQWKRRVPLIIKLPNQRTSIIFDESFSITNLQSIIEQVLKGSIDNSKVLQLIRSTTSTQMFDSPSREAKPYEAIASRQTHTLK